jgi:hypothetical protein
MKKVIITTAAFALALGLSGVAGAVDPTVDSTNSVTSTASGASASATGDSSARVNTDNSTSTKTSTRTPGPIRVLKPVLTTAKERSIATTLKRSIAITPEPAPIARPARRLTTAITPKRSIAITARPAARRRPATIPGIPKTLEPSVRQPTTRRLPARR